MMSLHSMRGNSAMNKLIAFALLALVFSGIYTRIHIASAQSSHADIYTYQDGDLWKYSLYKNEAMPLTHSGFNGGPVLSPDGLRLAFLEAAPAFVADYKSGKSSQTAGSPPTDIWLFHITEQRLEKIADQAGASSAGYLRSVPSWSPDSRQLAWLQIDPLTQSLEAASLQVYQLDTGATIRLAADVKLGFQESGINMPELRWGAGGIARLLYDFFQGQDQPFLLLELYQPTDGARRQFNLALQRDHANLVSDFMWADHLGQDVLLLRIQNHWEILNPQDGRRSRLIEAPRLKNRYLYGGLQLIPVAVATERGGWQFHWRAKSGDQLYETGFASRSVDMHRQPALSSDGTQVAWHNGEFVGTWTLGTMTEARAFASAAVAEAAFPNPGPVSLVWVPMQWQTVGEVLSMQAAPTSETNSSLCMLAPQLRRGQQAVLSPGLANRVRAAASLNAAIVGRIRAGQVVTIVQGPLCADGYNWYAVQGAGIAGWTVEGSAGDYWLLYHVDCPKSPPTRLGKGMIGAVSPGAANNMRDGAGTQGTTILGRLPAGTEFRITGYPTCDADGRRWFPIEYNQLNAWTAAGEGNEYWIEPAANQALG